MVDYGGRLWQQIMMVNDVVFFYASFINISNLQTVKTIYFITLSDSMETDTDEEDMKLLQLYTKIKQLNG